MASTYFSCAIRRATRMLHGTATYANMADFTAGHIVIIQKHYEFYLANKISLFSLSLVFYGYKVVGLWGFTVVLGVVRVSGYEVLRLFWGCESIGL